jgi:hypothetical protein
VSGGTGHEIAPRPAGKAVKVRLRLTNGKLYASLVSPDESVPRPGQVVAGGAGLTGLTDDVGAGAGR